MILYLLILFNERVIKIENIILGIVQGITEFVPVSSSGHLSIFSEFMDLPQDVGYYAILHLATFFAVFIFVFREIKEIIIGIFKRNNETINLVIKLLIATLPAAIVGLTIDNIIEEAFSIIKIIALFLILTGTMNIFSDKIEKNKKDLFSITFLDALLIGMMQSFAIFPGISRSGSTIFAALLIGMSRKSAVKFSFLMSLPVTFGAGILHLDKIDYNLTQNIGIIASFFSGLLGLWILKKTVIKGKLKYFGVYCFIMAVLVLIIL